MASAAFDVATHIYAAWQACIGCQIGMPETYLHAVPRLALACTLLRLAGAAFDSAGMHGQGVRGGHWLVAVTFYRPHALLLHV